MNCQFSASFPIFLSLPGIQVTVNVCSIKTTHDRIRTWLLRCWKQPLTHETYTFLLTRLYLLSCICTNIHANKLPELPNYEGDLCHSIHLYFCMHHVPIGKRENFKQRFWAKSFRIGQQKPSSWTRTKTNWFISRNSLKDKNEIKLNRWGGKKLIEGQKRIEQNEGMME